MSAIRDSTTRERPPADIVFDHVTKRYPGQATPAIDDLSLTVPAGETCCLVGPSGGGKTTAMKLINRLIDVDSGDITIGGRSIRSLEVTALRRDIGYVIQQVGLFPHMTVAANIGVIPGLLGWSGDRIRARTDELLDLVRLDRDFGKRYPAQLSGGQQQRVGLARALAVDPPVMLMDEPFGALDPITRTEIQDEFLNLESEIDKTVVFVTHDIDEAIKMGDRIAVFRQGGVLAQYGTADELLAHPADEYVADFVGADRGLKRLSLRTMRDVVTPDVLPDDGEGPSVDADASLRIGLSTLFAAGTDSVRVTDGDRVLGRVTLAELQGAVTRSAV
ncbi:ABC transporter ATP-binding protein [Actinomycetospora sp. CA-084318]|uniref:ABC transporter ATP-binding protein n=1 Tax=Actinomycetospora sp. CA-084318 TaxID=3239892 RepID=UPI003D966700